MAFFQNRTAQFLLVTLLVAVGSQFGNSAKHRQRLCSPPIASKSNQRPRRLPDSTQDTQDIHGFRWLEKESPSKRNEIPSATPSLLKMYIFLFIVDM